MSLQNTLDYRPAAARAGLAIAWTPYLVGIGIGVLSWVVFLVVNNPLGITTAIGQVSGAVATPILGAEAVAQNSYWARNVFKLDYGTLFLVGTLLGCLLYTSPSPRDRTRSRMPSSA